MYGIKRHILEMDKTSYAQEEDLLEEKEIILDCSTGINPFGLSERVIEELNRLSPESANLYGQSLDRVKKAIKGFWKELVPLSQDNIVLGDASIELIYRVNKLFIQEGDRILGYSPQFSDYIDDVHSWGGIYDYYLLSSDDGFKFDSKKYLDEMQGNHKLFYIDNPNNPTGQLIALEDIQAIARKAQSFNRVLLVDEAYGDYVDRANSAVSLLGDYDNLIVLRSFSKGLGLAGLRAGYLVSSTRITQELLKISNPFSMNNLARQLAVVALDDIDFMEFSVAATRKNKTEFVQSLNKIKVLETHSDVPIMVLKYPAQVDFQKLLLKNGILAVSGKSFIGLDESYVRLLISKDIDKLIEIFSKIEAETP